jgi:peroxiredoxin
MTKSIYLLSFVLISFIIRSQSSYNYSINGIAKKAKEGSYIYLHHKWNNKDYTDSVKVRAEKFSFNGKGFEPNMFWINLSSNINLQPNLIFFVDGGKTNIELNVDSIATGKVTGGQTQADYIEYSAFMKTFSLKQQAMVKDYNEARYKGDAGTMNTISGQYQTLEQDFKASIYNFVKTKPKSAVSGYAIYFNYQGNNVIAEELEGLVNLLDKKFLDTKYGQLAQEKLKQMRGTMIGYPAIEFSQASPEGKQIKLSEFKGKYVLVDFWASWCGPCRAENPNVVMAYQKYKDKGFTVFGVSLDSNKEAWLKAVDKDNLTWPQVSDLKGWQNDVAKLYGISSIPQNLLLDKEGKIIAKNLRGADLEAKLEELFK